jgi:nitrate reductase delta subunit
MFKNPNEPARLTLRALARLLAYPDAALRAQVPVLLDALRSEGALGRARLAELEALCEQLASHDSYALEARYVETFDRGHQTSLHLFEHVHGDSRERGPALLDLRQTYAQAGLLLDADELPDHLGVVLEYASTQPPQLAREFLGELTHILNAVFTALVQRGSPYASVVAAVLEVAGERAQAVPIAPEPELDAVWAEPPAFDGCSVAGQDRPAQPRSYHAVRGQRTSNSQGARA